MSLNRRAFLGGLFAILPAALTYKRVWREIAKTEMPDEAMVFNTTIETTSYNTAAWYENEIQLEDQLFIVKSIIADGDPQMNFDGWRRCDPPPHWPKAGFIAASDGDMIDLRGVKLLQYKCDFYTGKWERIDGPADQLHLIPKPAGYLGITTPDV